MKPGAADAEAMAFAEARLAPVRSVTETSFFRYEHHHRVLGDIALPVAASAATGEARAIRILSAGCATGEEAYSIAMTVRDRGTRLRGVPVEILAVDVSQAALDTAVKGSYPRARLAGVPPTYVRRYFVESADGWTVVPALSGMVKFLRYDLRGGLYLGKFDVVFCANVLLYFVEDAKRELVRHLAALVRKGGHLFLGHADGAAPPSTLFDASGLPGFIYRRR
jgi:chemotaxis methyl-accepting protein methylase